MTPSKNGKPLVSLLLAAMLAGAVGLAWHLIDTLRDSQRLSQELAELDDVKYGLFNANRWVDHISLIVEKKITEFKLDAGNRAAIQRSLQRMLDTLIVEVDRYMRKQNMKRKDSWWETTSGRLKQAFADIFVDVDDIRTAIPEYADIILQEMDKPEARQELNEAIRRVLTDLTQSTFAPIDMRLVEAIQQRHECSEVNFCRAIIQARLTQQDERARQLAYALLGLSLAIFLLIRIEDRRPAPSRFLALTSLATILMACGVLTPMLEVEARITELRFMLLEEPVVFRDQVLYFQSKSVLDMVQVLTATGALDMILVGMLIMLFSVLFPLAKLSASVLLLYGRERLRRNPLLRFFALKSGKWSMADVMVVAMFMAYIGFDGIVSSQLSGLAEAGASVDVITTNGTSLEIGFFMFLGFCLAGLLSAAWMESAMEAAPKA